MRALDIDADMTAAKFRRGNQRGTEPQRVEHDSGRRDNSHWLWSLLVLELWFRELEAKAGILETCSYSSRMLS